MLVESAQVGAVAEIGLGLQIPPQTPSYLVPTKCCYAGFEPAHGFAYRVHTHALGR